MVATASALLVSDSAVSTTAQSARAGALRSGRAPPGAGHGVCGPRLVHWPPRGRALVSTWKELLAARDQGLARAVGVSNYRTAQLDELIAATGAAPRSTRSRNEELGRIDGLSTTRGR